MQIDSPNRSSNRPCNLCHGTGKRDGKPCPACDGKGEIPQKSSLIISR